MAATAEKVGRGAGRRYAVTLVYGKRYWIFDRLFVKGVPQSVTAEEAAVLRDLRTMHWAGDREVSRFEVKAERQQRRKATASRPTARTASGRRSADAADTSHKTLTSRDLAEGGTAGATR